jgi:hypothetical protein
MKYKGIAFFRTGPALVVIADQIYGGLRSMPVMGKPLVEIIDNVVSKVPRFARNIRT